MFLFARYAELLGADQIEVALSPGARVSELIAALRALPGGGSLPATPFVAVNHVQADPTAPLPLGAEVALLPPLAGG